jgi:hypothetical protein
MSVVPDACSIEIYEAGRKSGPGGASVIVPNEVRINGMRVLAANEPIVVHEIKAGGGDVMMVTLTLFARRVTIGAELDD